MFALDRVAQLQALMGREALLALADQLAQGLVALPQVPAADRANHLHRLRGGAASLGFLTLAADIEKAELEDGDIMLLVQQASAVVPSYEAALHEASRHR